MTSPDEELGTMSSLRTKIIVYGYIRNQSHKLFLTIPMDVIEMCISFVDSTFYLVFSKKEFNELSNDLNTNPSNKKSTTKFLDSNRNIELELSLSRLFVKPYEYVLSVDLKCLIPDCQMTVLCKLSCNAIRNDWKRIMIGNDENDTDFTHVTWNIISLDPNATSWNSNCNDICFMCEIEILKMNMLNIHPSVAIINNQVKLKKRSYGNIQKYKWEIKKPMNYKWYSDLFDKKHKMWCLYFQNSNCNFDTKTQIMLCLCRMPKLFAKIRVVFHYELSIRDMNGNEITIKRRRTQWMDYGNPWMIIQPVCYGVDDGMSFHACNAFDLSKDDTIVTLSAKVAFSK